jgi:hypothetical protein
MIQRFILLMTQKQLRLVLVLLAKLLSVTEIKAAIQSLDH